MNIEFIYSNKDREPYNDIELRIAISLQLIVSSKHLINPILSSLIAQDICELMKNEKYLSRFDDKEKKIKSMELELTNLMKKSKTIKLFSIHLG